MRLDHYWRAIAAFGVPWILAACSTVELAPPPPDMPQSPGATSPPRGPVPALPPAGSGKGAYYKDDGPADVIPQGLLDTPDAVPRIEPYSQAASRPYSVLGWSYTPITDDRPFKQRGVGSWYGKKFHGQKTSSGELYDMFKMTAAHPTLPLPSYARVTNLGNNKQVIVRINDRGPFHSSRIIDLSYTAALKLGYLGKGSGLLEVERILPEEIARMASAKREVQAEAPGGVVPAEYVKPVATVGAAPPVDAAPPASLSSAPPVAVPGFYLQLGAYMQAPNAEAARAKIMQGWTNDLPGVEITASGKWYRLQSGPFATRVEAAAVAQRLQAAGVVKPMIVQR